MNNRLVAFIGFLFYLAGTSFFFGAVFSGNKEVIPNALIALFIAQLTAVGLLLLVHRKGRNAR